ncbi:hypothetical protein [Campylobacter rectus]|uniref:hypothetical protein n=1 Tax=Campylobacter rectus TaxID=203 RepID=UPI0028EC086A|nr:hypothetical protein [Campylobacter rectus]
MRQRGAGGLSGLLGGKTLPLSGKFSSRVKFMAEICPPLYPKTELNLTQHRSNSVSNLKLRKASNLTPIPKY